MGSYVIFCQSQQHVELKELNGRKLICEEDTVGLRQPSIDCYMFNRERLKKIGDKKNKEDCVCIAVGWVLRAPVLLLLHLYDPEGEPVSSGSFSDTGWSYDISFVNRVPAETPMYEARYRDIRQCCSGTCLPFQDWLRVSHTIQYECRIRSKHDGLVKGKRIYDRLDDCFIGWTIDPRQLDGVCSELFREVSQLHSYHNITKEREFKRLHSILVGVHCGHGDLSLLRQLFEYTEVNCYCHWLKVLTSTPVVSFFLPLVIQLSLGTSDPAYLVSHRFWRKNAHFSIFVFFSSLFGGEAWCGRTQFWGCCWSKGNTSSRQTTAPRAFSKNCESSARPH